MGRIVLGLCLLGLLGAAACSPIPVEVRHSGSVDVLHHDVQPASTTTEPEAPSSAESESEPKVAEGSVRDKQVDPFADLSSGVLTGAPNPSACNKGLNFGVLSGLC